MADILFDGISKVYAGRPAVDDLHLSVRGGELVCLLGPSGCGKTTTLRMLAGFITPDSGDITLDGRSLLPLGPEARPTAMVFQRYTLWPHMNVFHNVAFGLKLRREGAGAIQTKVGRALSLVGLPGMERRAPAQLSGGQQQRVALARALVLEPKVLLLDEPLSSLDAKLRVQLRGEIKSIQQELGITTVFVTHDQEEAMAVADRIAVMEGGVLQQVESPPALYARPATRFVANFIGDMNWLPGTLVGRSVRAGELHFDLDAPTTASGEVEIALRPEDVVFSEGGHPAQVERVTDLGHYREVRLRLGEVRLSAFVSKGQRFDVSALEAGGVAVRRALVYADGQLLGEAVPVPAPISVRRGL